MKPQIYYTLMSAEAVDELAGAMGKKFMVSDTPECRLVDVEAFAKKRLHGPVQYLELAEEDRNKLAFTATGAMPSALSKTGTLCARSSRKAPW